MKSTTGGGGGPIGAEFMHVGGGGGPRGAQTRSAGGGGGPRGRIDTLIILISITCRTKRVVPYAQGVDGGSICFGRRWRTHRREGGPARTQLRLIRRRRRWTQWVIVLMDHSGLHCAPIPIISSGNRRMESFRRPGKPRASTDMPPVRPHSTVTDFARFLG